MKRKLHWTHALPALLLVAVLVVLFSWIVSKVPDQTYPKLQLVFTMLGGVVTISVLAMEWVSKWHSRGGAENRPSNESADGDYSTQFLVGRRRMVDRLQDYASARGIDSY